MKKLLALLLTAAMLLTASACVNIPEWPDPTRPPDTAITSAPSGTPAPSAEGNTYRLALSDAPVNWSPVSWQTSCDAALMKLIGSPLVDITIAENGVDFAWVFEMATALEDVTASYPGREALLQPDESGALPDAGFIYKIELNPDACWEDGTPITAETYIYSMKQLLSISDYRGGYDPFTDGAAAIRNAAAYRAGGADWESVGLIAEGGCTLYYITENYASRFEMLSVMTSNRLVFEPLYEAGRANGGPYVPSDYCTSVDTTVSCGPYRLESIEDGHITLVRNANWYGFSDGRHEGQYQADRVEFSVIPDRAEALAAFLRGELDEIPLDEAEAFQYRASDKLLKLEETNVDSCVFATDIEKLIALEEEAGDGTNKRVLSYDDFRKAISLSIDRAKLCLECTPGYKPACCLLNELYYCDIQNDPASLYRRTDAGRRVMLELYGVEYESAADNADAAYDVEKARALFEAVYERAAAEGNYSEGQLIKLRCAASGGELTNELILRQEYLNECVAEACEGTGFEGKIIFEFVGNYRDRQRAVAEGGIEMILTSCGGAAFDPFSVICYYCEPDYLGGLFKINESCGWDPTVETMTISYGGKEMTDTLQNWAKSINDGGRYAGPEYEQFKELILGGLEYEILASYQCIPLYSRTSCRLISDRISYAAHDYNLMYGFGGLRLMRFD